MSSSIFMAIKIGAYHGDMMRMWDMTIDVLFPLVGWLIEGWLLTTLTTGFYDDRWYTSSRPLYFYQKDIIGIWLGQLHGPWGLVCGEGQRLAAWPSLVDRRWNFQWYSQFSGWYIYIWHLIVPARDSPRFFRNSEGTASGKSQQCAARMPWSDEHHSIWQQEKCEIYVHSFSYIYSVHIVY